MEHQIRAEYVYYLNAGDECAAKGFSGFASFHEEMKAMLIEKRDFYRAYPSRRARRDARKEGSKMGRYY